VTPKWHYSHAPFGFAFSGRFRGNKVIKYLFAYLSFKFNEVNAIISAAIFGNRTYALKTLTKMV